MKTYITSIGIANPEIKVEQQRAGELLAEALELESREGRRLSALYRTTGIENRHTVIKDYLKQRGEYEFLPNVVTESFPTIGKRMEMYEQEALPLAIEAVENCFSNQSDCKYSNITHLITVSCTGMYAPGIDIELVQHFNINPDVKRTAINFMGCYAAFNAIKVADAFCKSDSNAKVLIVCVELCTLHLQKNTNSDHLVSNAIFADGAAAVLVQATPAARVSLSLESAYCSMSFQGKQEMAWHISDMGFIMTLTSYVPTLIKEGVKELVGKLLKNMNLTLSQIDYFAIHPGGRRILEVIEEELGLTKQDNRYAYEVWRRYGNMSSPTVLFVLNSILKEVTPLDKDKTILSFAFGPGLTMESILLKVN